MRRSVAIRAAAMAAALLLLVVGCTANEPVEGGSSVTTTTKDIEVVVTPDDGTTTTTGTDTTTTTTAGNIAGTTTTTGSSAAIIKPTMPPETYAVKPFTYPESAVQTLFDRMISKGSLVARAAGSSDYVGNRHYTGTNIVISPDFTAKIDGQTLPVYATPVYVARGNRGVLHAFASVDVAFGSHASVKLELTAGSDISVSSVQVYAHDAASVTRSGNTVTLTVSKHGVYTVVLNDAQSTAFTLFVREYVDEDKAIAAYRQKYGADHVQVFEPGIHEIDHIMLAEDNSVLYLKAGAILLPKHTFDIMDDSAAANTEELNAKTQNELGLNRYPVVNGYASDNLIIAGRGTVDMTQLDWHERRGIVFSLCDNVTMDGVIIVNPCEWSFITYRCQNVTVTQSAVLGYRTNSDAFAICNSVNVSVSDCFARTGDDMFEVKTLGGVATAVSRDITFRRCQAWGSKARCFGIIGEVEKDISNVLFEDGIVIFRDATWDNNRIGSLVVLRETGNGAISNITFRNIVIHKDYGRAINCGVYSSDLSGSRIDNILFENVTYTGDMNSQLRLNSGSGNRMSVILKNVIANGVTITSKNAENFFYCDKSGMLTVK